MPPDPFALAPARVHEVQGPGRTVFALYQAMRHPGPILWVLPPRGAGLPMPWGLPPGVAERLLILRPRREVDLLWSTEEALREAATGFVIAEPEKPLSLTAGRRLQLAAEAGRTPGLMLIAEGAGSNAAETRWHCDLLAAPRADSTWHRWSLTKNKSGTMADWTLDWDGTSSALHLVSPAGQRCQPAAPPG